MLIDVVKLSETLCKHPIKAKLKYATAKNFVGRPIKGYDPQVTNIALMTRKPARQLCEVQNHLLENYGHGLLVYDAYRPKRAVHDFISWCQLEPGNEYELERKTRHYPNIQKNQLFELGYLSEDSGHCYGNTVDLVLLNIQTEKKLNMGACYDYMDEKSHCTADINQIGEEAYKNRKILSQAMQQFGFQPCEKEFWHFSHGGKEGREVQEPMDVEITVLNQKFFPE